MVTDRFKTPVSNKLDWNEAIKETGSTLRSIFGKPAQTTVIKETTPIDTKDKDNTMLYVGLGGAALVVILLIIFMVK